VYIDGEHRENFVAQFKTLIVRVQDFEAFSESVARARAAAVLFMRLSALGLGRDLVYLA